MGKMKKSDLQERVEAVAKLLLVGARPSQIVRTLSPLYKVDERTVKRYIREAKTLLAFNYDDAAEDYQLDLRRFEYLYQQILEKGNPVAAIRALEAKNNIRREYLKHQSLARMEQSGHDLSFLKEAMDDQ